MKIESAELDTQLQQVLRELMLTRLTTGAFKFQGIAAPQAAAAGGGKEQEAEGKTCCIF